MADIVVSHGAGLRSESGQFLSSVEFGAKKAVLQIAHMIKTEAIATAPVESGRLRASVRALTRGNVGYATADTPYARGYEKGNRPHIIARKNPKDANIFGGPLSNRDKGFFSRTYVNHPGNRPFLWLTAAGRKVAAVSGAIVKAHMPG